MVPPSCSLERNVKKIREPLSKRQAGHCVAEKVALVPCLVPSPLHQEDPGDLGLYRQSCDCVIWMPDLPNFYLANKLNVLLLVFGINT